MEVKNFSNLSRSERLCILGARINELETRTPGVYDLDKLERVYQMFWRVLDSTVDDAEWQEFCDKNRMVKYLKYLGELK